MQYIPFPISTTTTSLTNVPDLGNRYTSGKSLYRLFRASVAIASGSQGLQLAMVQSAGVPINIVTLNVATGSHLICGAIPSILTGPIAASGLFLALVEGTDTLATTSTGVASITSGSLLISGTASDLVRAGTAVAAADIDERSKICGFGLIASTATTTALAYTVTYRAPLR